MLLKDAITWAFNASACAEALDALDAIDVQAELEGIDAWDMLLSWDDIDASQWLRWFTVSTYRSNKIIGVALNVVYDEYLVKLRELEALDRDFASKEPRKEWFAKAATILREAPALLI